MLDLVSAVAVFVMVIYISLNRFSYFKPFRAYFILIYTGFLAFLAREAVLLVAGDDYSLIEFTTQLLASASAVIAALWGHLAIRLYVHPERFSLRDIFSFSRKQTHLLYQLYLVPLTLFFIVTWAYPFFPSSGNPIITGPNISATYPLEGGAMLSSVRLQPWYLGMAAIVVGLFLTYPNWVLFRLRSQLRDKEVRYALRAFAVYFGFVSVVIFATNALADFRVSLMDIGNFVNVLLLSIVVKAFRRPSFLKAFLGVVPSFVTSGEVKEDQTVVLYASTAEKYGPFSRFVLEGVNKRQQVVCFYHGNEADFREQLDQNNVNVNNRLLKGNLRLLPIQSLYQQAGNLDELHVLDVVRDLEEDARSQGRDGLRILLDYGDFVRRPIMRFVEHLKNPHWTRPDHFVSVLMGFEKQALDNQEALGSLRAGVQVLDLSEAPEVFSRKLGLSHNEMTGKKILYEYDLLSDVDKNVKALAAESASNLERTVVFTRSDSPARSLEGNEPGLKIFLLTTRVSKPSYEKENLVLLPTYDSSLVLDSLDKTVDSYSAAPFTVVFDNISHMVFTLGRDRAYSFVRQALELMASNRVTAVFLLNINAHEQKTISMFESLFDMEIMGRPGARTLEIRNKLSPS